jgi:hydroxyacylglutathione hydrolase
MKLIPLPAFEDNYIWLLHDGQHALVVDPGDAAPVLQALASHKLVLKSILVTHHHGDHTGGVDLLHESTGAQVYGPASEDVPQPLQGLKSGDSVQAMGLTFTVMDVPGHTAGHIAFYCADMDGTPLLFCGDTLFSAGCGRLFEGTAAQMQNSLAQLSALPHATHVCCAHEYTLSNLKFAREIEPDNRQIAAYESACKTLRAGGKPTLPSSIGLEKQINPFLRSHLPVVAASAQRFDASSVEREGVFATLRQWKNQYR